MKSKMNRMMIVMLGIMVLFYGCDRSSTTEPVKADNELSNTEQMDIIAAEIAASNGGIMADIATATSYGSGQSAGLAKITGFDTTFNVSWITYSLKLAFYNANGREQIRYVEGVTDKVVYQGTLTGDYHPTNGKQEIYLNRNTFFNVSGITTDTLTLSGTSINTSQYQFTGARINMTVNAQSQLTVNNLVLNKNSNIHIPENGLLEGKLEGKYTKDGVIQQKDVDYTIDFTIEFSGGNTVTVTLKNGTTFTLNLATGAYSQI